MTPTAENKPFVAIACGGTGGHLFPGIAVGEQLLARDCRVALIISPKEVDQQAIKSAHGMEIVTLPAVALQRGSRLAFLAGFWKSYCASRKLFRERCPQAVLAMGGFTAAPPALAARRSGSKTFLHESNTIPGRANRWLARIVDGAFIGFPETRERLRTKQIIVTGTPVRPQFSPRDPAGCRRTLSLDPSQPVMLVMGGSQGASGVNEMILSALSIIAQRAPQMQWLHLAGPNDAGKVEAAYRKLSVRALVRPFMAEMDLAMGAATACVSRAGASSLAEIAAMKLPSLLVPFPHAADDHQFHNALAFSKTGAARLLEQKDAMPQTVTNMVLDLVENTSVRNSMQAALTQWHAPKAAEQIAEEILKMVAAGAANRSKEGASTHPPLAKTMTA